MKKSTSNKYGAFLRELRIDREISLRDFAKSSGMDVGNLSKIERGILDPPQSKIQNKFIKLLNLNEKDSIKLKDLASHQKGNYPPEVEDDLKEYEYIPILLRTIANKRLTDEQIRELTKKINSL